MKDEITSGGMYGCQRLYNIHLPSGKPRIKRLTRTQQITEVKKSAKGEKINSLLFFNITIIFS